MTPTVSALWSSIVRTIVPVIVGYVLGAIAATGIQVDAQFEPLLTAALGSAFTALYYVAVRLFETYVSPNFGWLLGLAKSPTAYVAKHEK